MNTSMLLSRASLEKARRIPVEWRLREPVNGLTHCIGAILAFIGLTLLIREAAFPLKPLNLLAFAVYGISMILLYASSTVFHWLPLEDDETSGFRKLDHIMIFVFIAATYTPFCLIPLRNGGGLGILLCIWTIAGIGGVSKLYWIQTPPWITALIYVIVGSFAFLCFGQIKNSLSNDAVFWVVSGGISYCIGALIYAVERPDPFPQIFGFHEIFHIFVMVGSTAHFWAIYRYVAMQG